MGTRQDIEFKTLDGLVLRGFLYSAAAKGPALVMTPGFNFPISFLHHEVALIFQQVGISTLIYDTRTVGKSDGTPRSDIDPAKQAEDLSDAITFLKTKPMVDPTRIGLWGYSVSGAVSLVTAGLDPRVKLVITISPAPIPYNFDAPGKRKKYLDLAVRDRESQARGREPFYVQYISDSEETALFDYRRHRDQQEADYDEIIQRLGDLSPGFRNEVTVQTLPRLAAWSLGDAPERLVSTPVLLVLAENEELEHIRKTQEEIWTRLAGPKERHVEAERGHMDVLTPDGERFTRLVKIQTDFVLKHLG